VLLLGQLVLTVSGFLPTSPRHLEFAPLSDPRLDPGLRTLDPGPLYMDNSGLEKRGQRSWKMRMFKKSEPRWQMRMFKRGFVLPEEMAAKRTEGRWKMRMFKRPEAAGLGKRPDRWQMRMFKRDPELSQEYPSRKR